VADVGKIGGLVTDYAIRRAVGEGRNIIKMTIREIMNSNPLRVYVDEKAIQALKIIEEREKPLAVLPVVDSDSIVRGMIHLHDLIDKGLCRSPSHISMPSCRPEGAGHGSVRLAACSTLSNSCRSSPIGR